VYYGVFVQDGDDLLLVNTEYGVILRFDEDAETFEAVHGQIFPVTSHQASVLAVSDDSLSGCV
jgi:hypothetical protein